MGLLKKNNFGSDPGPLKNDLRKNLTGHRKPVRVSRLASPAGFDHDSLMERQTEKSLPQQSLSHPDGKCEGKPHRLLRLNSSH